MTIRRALGAVGVASLFVARISASAMLTVAIPALANAQSETNTPFPASVSQGQLVVAHFLSGSDVRYGGRKIDVSPDGSVVFGVGRDEKGPLRVSVRNRSGARDYTIGVSARAWPIERVEGVPPKTVEPPAAIAERIRREQARVVLARTRDDPRTDYETRFTWPVTGRISGRFGNQRIYNGVPKAPHSGMDIAVPQGTPVKAPAAGIITFADRDLYLTGGTVLLDHGHGVSSNFLHLSRIDVKVGDHVHQGQVIGAVGMTGRATGPHLHWGMNWFDVRVDPLLVAGIR